MRDRAWHSVIGEAAGASRLSLRKDSGGGSHSAVARAATDMIMERLGAGLTDEERKDVAYDLNDAIYKAVRDLFR